MRRGVVAFFQRTLFETSLTFIRRRRRRPGSRQHRGVQKLGELANFQHGDLVKDLFHPTRGGFVPCLDFQNRVRELYAPCSFENAVGAAAADASTVDADKRFVAALAAATTKFLIREPHRARKRQVHVKGNPHGVAVGPLKRDAAVLGAHAGFQVFF